MGRTETTKYDVAEHLRSREEMAAYLDACMEEADGDAAFIAKALGDIARAQGMAWVAQEAGLSRESLYKALSGERILAFDTVLKVLKALGLRIHADVRSEPMPAEGLVVAEHPMRRIQKSRIYGRGSDSSSQPR